jgi:hypothetical protein
VVDGFEKEGALCMVIMNSPTLPTGGSFAGIKPAVILLDKNSAKDFSVKEETTPVKKI